MPFRGKSNRQASDCGPDQALPLTYHDAQYSLNWAESHFSPLYNIGLIAYFAWPEELLINKVMGGKIS